MSRSIRASAPAAMRVELGLGRRHRPAASSPRPARAASTAARSSASYAPSQRRTVAASNRSVLYWHSSAHAAVHLHGVDEQLEVLEAARRWRRTRTRGPGNRTVSSFKRLVEVEQHADQRQPARVARDRQLLQQGAEGVAAGVRRRRAAIALRRLQHRPNACRHRRPKRTGSDVDAVADQAVVAADRLARPRRCRPPRRTAPSVAAAAWRTRRTGVANRLAPRRAPSLRRPRRPARHRA